MIPRFVPDEAYYEYFTHSICRLIALAIYPNSVLLDSLFLSLVLAWYGVAALLL